MGEGAHAPSRPGVFIAVALLSAGVLGYEILLARLLAIVHWHHFAYMIIAVALLGFGAAGSLVAVLQRPLLRHFRWTFGGAALGFGAGAPLAFALAQSLPFNALEIAWDRAQFAWLFALYLVLSLPFLSRGAGAGAGLPGERRACRCALPHGPDGCGLWRPWHGLPARRATARRCTEGRGCVRRRLRWDCAPVGEGTTTRRGVARCWRWPPGSPCPQRSPITGCARIPRPTRG